MKTFIVWNPNKLDSYLAADQNPKSYQSLLAHEEKDGGLSSVVTGVNIAQYSDSINNEWDGEVCFHEIETVYNLVVYSKGSYKNYNEAARSGGTYQLNGIKASNLAPVYQSFLTTSECIGNNDCVMGFLLNGVFVDITEIIQ